MQISEFCRVKGYQIKNLISLLSDQMRQIFDDMYWARILGRDMLGSSTMDETAAILWAVLNSHEVMSEFYKYEIKRHLSIKSIFVRFLITTNISEPLQEIIQMKRDIKLLSTKSDYHQVRLNNLKE